MPEGINNFENAQEHLEKKESEKYDFRPVVGDVLDAYKGKKTLSKLEDKIREAIQKNNLPENVRDEVFSTIEKDVRFQFYAEKRYDPLLDELVAYLNQNQDAKINSRWFHVHNKSIQTLIVRDFRTPDGSDVDWEFFLKKMQARLKKSGREVKFSGTLLDHFDRQEKTEWSKNKVIHELHDIIKNLSPKDFVGNKTVATAFSRDRYDLYDALKRRFRLTAGVIDWESVKEALESKYPGSTEGKRFPGDEVKRSTRDFRKAPKRIYKKIAEIGKEAYLAEMAKELQAKLEEKKPERFTGTWIHKKNGAGLNDIRKASEDPALKMDYSDVVRLLPEQWQRKFQIYGTTEDWYKSVHWKNGENESKEYDKVVSQLPESSATLSRLPDEIEDKYDEGILSQYYEAYEKLAFLAQDGNKFAFDSLMQSLELLPAFRNEPEKKETLPTPLLTEARMKAIRNFRESRKDTPDFVAAYYRMLYQERNRADKRGDDLEMNFYEIEKAIRDFESATSEKDLKTKFEKEIGESARDMFAPENLESLQEMDSGKRIAFLSHSFKDLSVGPDEIDAYLAEFPDDLQVVEQMYQDVDGKTNSLELHMLFSAFYPYFSKDQASQSSSLEDKMYENIAERRLLAHEFLLQGEDASFFRDKLSENKGISRSLLAGMHDALRFRKGGTEGTFDPTEYFDENFQNISPDEQREALVNMIGVLQAHMVRDEVYRGVESRESVEAKRDFLSRALAGDMSVPGSFDPNHSILFESAQPISIYARDLEGFLPVLSYGQGDNADQYALHRYALEVLQRLSESDVDDSDIDFVIEFWGKNRNPIFGSRVGQIVNKNPEHSSAKLLELIKDESGDARALTSMLYRLEFGQIGISEEGAEYLGRVYDLGEFNNPDFHVQRLSVDGDMGIFEEQELIKYFALGDLESEEDYVKANVLDFTYEKLFASREGETDEEKAQKERFLEEFKSKYEKIANDKIFEQTGVRLNNLSLKEQGRFVIFFNQADDERKDRLRQFVSQYAETGIKAFLSLEADEGAGSELLDIADTVRPAVAKEFIEKLATINSRVNEGREDLQRRFIKSDKEIDVYSGVLSRANGLIKSFAKKIQSSGYAEASSRQKAFMNEDLRAQFSKIDAEAHVLAGIFREAFAKGEIQDFDEVNGVDFQTVSDLSREEIEGMKTIIAENYKDKRGEYMQKALDEAVSQENSQWYILKQQAGSGKPQVLSFMHFRSLGNNEVMAELFNVYEGMKGAKIGTLMYELAMDRIALEYRIRGKVNVMLPAAGDLYISRKGGFSIDGIEENEFGNLLFSMVRDNKIEPTLSRDFSGDDAANALDSVPDDEVSFILRCDLSNKENVKAMVALAKKKGYIGSRYFQKDGEGFILYERVLDSNED